MAIGAGMSCVKYLLFCVNLLFAITGLIILIVGVKAEIGANPYVDLTDESFYTSAPMVLIIVGLIVFIVAFFGCCGAVKENHCMIVTFEEYHTDAQEYEANILVLRSSNATVTDCELDYTCDSTTAAFNIS